MNFRFLFQEQLLVDGEELDTNNLKEVFESFLLDLELRLLRSHELLKLVEGALLNFGEDSRGDNLELVDHLHVARLEFIDLFVGDEAIRAALVHEGISLCKPIESDNTGSNEVIE